MKETKAQPGKICEDCRSASICQYKDSKPTACTLKHNLGATSVNSNKRSK